MPPMPSAVPEPNDLTDDDKNLCDRCGDICKALLEEDGEQVCHACAREAAVGRVLPPRQPLSN
jgi:hypothetical protein